MRLRRALRAELRREPPDVAPSGACRKARLRICEVPSCCRMCANCALRPTTLPIRPALRPANFRSAGLRHRQSRAGRGGRLRPVAAYRRLSRPVPDVDGGRYAVAVAVCGADGRFPRRAARLRVGRFPPSKRSAGLPRPPKPCRRTLQLPKVALFLPHPLLPSLPGPAPTASPPPRKAVFPRPQPLPPPAPCALPPLHSLSHRGRLALLAAVGSRHGESRQAVLRKAGSLWARLRAEDYVHEELAWRLEVQ